MERLYAPLYFQVLGRLLQWLSAILSYPKIKLILDRFVIFGWCFQLNITSNYDTVLKTFHLIRTKLTITVIIHRPGFFCWGQFFKIKKSILVSWSSLVGALFDAKSSYCESIITFYFSFFVKVVSMNIHHIVVLLNRTDLISPLHFWYFSQLNIISKVKPIFQYISYYQNHNNNSNFHPSSCFFVVEFISSRWKFIYLYIGHCF